MVSHTTKTDRREMPTPSLPAASLSGQIRLPARRVLRGVANNLIRLALWSIGAAILRAGSNFLPALREGERSVDREVPRDDAILEDAAAAVREVALLGETVECAADLLRPVAGNRRYVLGKVVAETPTGHEDRLETAGASHSGERVGHRLDGRVDREIGPVGGEAAAGGERIEAARPEHPVALGRARRAVEVDEDRIELRRRSGDVALRGFVHDRLTQVEP